MNKMFVRPAASDDDGLLRGSSYLEGTIFVTGS
jgi:hypothetical protein